MTSRQRIGAGFVLLVLAAGCWFLHAAGNANGRHSWQDGDPPSTVTLQPGRVYYISTRGGITDSVARDATLGGQPLTCTYATSAGTSAPLSTTVVGADSRQLHRVASFLAPAGGPLTISCPALGTVYIDDATDASFDVAGLLVIPTVVFGFFGVVMVLAGVSRLSQESQVDDANATDFAQGEWLAPSG